ncbi:MAG: RecQ family ATP-dependent DNA helicase [Flavobacteriales bacterium]|nr:RecQ family ATP-dependent DNA helicase [Flavobacteriales bacterium]
MQAEPLEILEQYWGFTSFRPKQSDIIYAVMLGQDTLALMPTGGGKSLCFQVPALAKEGICVVISPLVALMKDQVDRLKSMDVRAAYITAAQSRKEIDHLLDSAIYGNMKFLYVSPERLKSELFIERFKKMPVNLIAVDEAHCISQWGHDFRPAYREISGIREHHPNVPIIAVTASATPEVADDIVEQLELNAPARFESSMVRKNLNYVVLDEVEPLGRLLRACKRIGGSGIVYAPTRKQVRATAEFLNSHGIQAGYYHAGIDAATKEKLQQDWLKNKFSVMVATNAFGMGIDKPDVRFVVHIQPPQNLENYVQEAGRAGRDGDESWAILMWNTKMVERLTSQLHDRFSPKDQVKDTYHQLNSFFQIAFAAGLNEQFTFDLSAFSKQYDRHPRDVYFDIETLEMSGYLSMSEGAMLPSRVMFQMQAQELYNFQVRNEQHDAFIRLLLRTYGGLFETYSRIDEHFLARKTGWSTGQVRETLARLDNMQVLSYRPRTEHPTITFLTGRQQKENLIIPPEAYEERIERSVSRWEAMMRYLHHDGCRSHFVATYFGDEESALCGVCDWCRKEKIVAYDVRELIKESLLSAPTDLSGLIDQHSEVPREEIITQLNRSMDDGEVSRDEEDLLHWTEERN